MSNEHLADAKRLTLPGILLIIFGVIAIATPAVAGTAVVYVIGILLLIGGGAHVIHGLRGASWSSKAMGLILGVIMVLGGLGVVGHPLLGLTFLTLLLAIYFVVEGFWKIIAAFSFRPASGWLLILASGVITLFLGALIWGQWPLSDLWAVGVLVGVDMLLTGASLIGVASTARQLEKLGGSPAA